jgi:hypothetical protein
MSKGQTMPQRGITVVASEIPMLTFEVSRLKNEIGMAPALIRANKLANIIIGENRYNAYVSPEKGNETNV